MTDERVLPINPEKDSAIGLKFDYSRDQWWFKAIARAATASGKLELRQAVFGVLTGLLKQIEAIKQDAPAKVAWEAQAYRFLRACPGWLEERMHLTPAEVDRELKDAVENFICQEKEAKKEIEMRKLEGGAVWRRSSI